MKLRIQIVDETEETLPIVEDDSGQIVARLEPGEGGNIVHFRRNRLSLDDIARVHQTAATFTFPVVEEAAEEAAE